MILNPWPSYYIKLLDTLSNTCVWTTLPLVTHSGFSSQSLRLEVTQANWSVELFKSKHLNRTVSNCLVVPELQVL